MGYRIDFWENRSFVCRTWQKIGSSHHWCTLLQAIFYNVFILFLWLRIIRSSDQGVCFMNSSHIFFNDINHGYREPIFKKIYLWLFPFLMAVATYCYYDKVRRTIRTAIVSYLLKHFQSCILEMVKFIIKLSNNFPH